MKMSEKKFETCEVKADDLSLNPNTFEITKGALKGFSKNVLVNRFSFKLKSLLKLHALDEYQFKFINDLSFDKSCENAIKRELLKKKLLREISQNYSEKKHQSTLDKIRFFCLKNFKRLSLQFSLSANRETYLKIISPFTYMAKVHIPDGLFRISFDVICLILIVWEILMIPLLLSFPEINDGTVQFIESSISTFFLVDIFLNFNTGFYLRGNLVLKRRKIAQNYLKTWFWLDTLSSFPYDWLIPPDDNQNTAIDLTSSNSTTLLKILRFAKFLKILRLLRALKLKKIFGKLEDYLQLSMTFNAILACMRLLFLMICIAHWFACIWHIIASWEAYDVPNTWLRVYGVMDEDWNTRYVYSIYWAITTMVTVGYGDITPSTPTEKIYAIICMLLACGIFGYIMNRIGSIFSSFEENSFEYKIKVLQINQYMRKKNIPKSMQVKVRKYVEYTYDPDKKKQMDESSFFQCLSANLQTELSEYMNGIILTEFKLLAKILSKKMLNRLATSFKEHTYGPEDIIIDSKSLPNEEETFLYFLYKGIACCYFEDCNLQLTIMKDGSSFGEVSFFSTANKGANVKSLDFIYVYKISNKVFLSITERERLKEDKEVYFQIKDQIELYQNFSVLDIRCFSCWKSDHLISDCPFIHYVLKADELLRRNNKKANFFSRQFKRNPDRKIFHAKHDFVLIESSAIAVMNVIKIIRDEGLEDQKGQRILIGTDEDLEENSPFLGNSSFMNFTKFKEEADFNKIIKLKSNENEIPVGAISLLGCSSTEPQIRLPILFFQPSPGSPKTRKSISVSPKNIMKLARKSQNFTESYTIESSLSEKQEAEPANNQSEKLTLNLPSKVQMNEYGESFQIDKIESFSKYFPNYNFDVVAKKVNRMMKNGPLKMNNKSHRDDLMNAKIELVKKKTIKIRKGQPLSMAINQKESLNLGQRENGVENEKGQQGLNDSETLQNEINEERKKTPNDLELILNSLDVVKVEEWLRKRKES